VIFLFIETGFVKKLNFLTLENSASGDKISAEGQGYSQKYLFKNQSKSKAITKVKNLRSGKSASINLEKLFIYVTSFVSVDE